jgi:spermidine synthase
VEPDNQAALRQAAWVLATSPEASVRNGGEAVKLAERAAGLPGGGDPAVLDVLAAAYAEAGRFAQAAQAARKAMTIAAEQGKQPLAEAIKGRLGLYESGAPFRDAPSQR